MQVNSGVVRYSVKAAHEMGEVKQREKNGKNKSLFLKSCKKMKVTFRNSSVVSQSELVFGNSAPQ